MDKGGIIATEKKDVVGERLVPVLLDKMVGETQRVSGSESLVWCFLCRFDIFSSSWLSAHLEAPIWKMFYIQFFVYSCSAGFFLRIKF